MIEQRWTMQNSDINQVGTELGYDWNQICDEVSKDSLHGQDGSGFCEVARGDEKEFSSPILKAIFTEIFRRHPSMNSITVMDDF